MNLKIKAFGITKDIVGGREFMHTTQAATVAALKEELRTAYPRLIALRSLMVAVNNAYADDGLALKESDEIALIPPVSGG